MVQSYIDYLHYDEQARSNRAQEALKARDLSLKDRTVTIEENESPWRIADLQAKTAATEASTEKVNLENILTRIRQLEDIGALYDYIDLYAGTGNNSIDDTIRGLMIGGKFGQDYNIAATDRIGKQFTAIPRALGMPDFQTIADALIAIA